MKWLCKLNFHKWEHFMSPVKVMNHKNIHITNKYFHFRECKRCKLLQQSSYPENSIFFLGWKTIKELPKTVSLVKTKR